MRDYFAFYGLPVSFSPDPLAVKQKFYALSKQYHPDFYINESEEKQLEVLELSTLNNKAYQVLSDPGRLLPYVLELKGVLTEGEHYMLPQDFLMEMMEVNEALMDLQFDPDADKLSNLTREVEEVEKGIATRIAALSAGFEELNEARQEKVLRELKDLYYRSKYLVRIRAGLAKAGV
ncbi:Fe-S protein assembly co-chaperone HscB [Pedobacter sp. JY14-1]|uniref:Fe-S protein assembly co-chaperone HscB n=1 Tax=Pedobacter sp. JY14-1 TaxID=3034151 RepID=UPI0023E25242|nr:Fe-S protein assembly co-chaperone HscB [Pedobacter sp. JY14-1]